MYIGSTTNFSKRRTSHTLHLKDGKHKNRRLQKDFDRYGGIEAFEIYEICKSPTQKLALKFEQIMIDGSCNPYNILSAGSAKGRTYTKVTRDKMSASAKGKVIPLEQREKISKALRDSKLSNEVRKKMSEAHKERADSTLRFHTAKLETDDVYEIYKLYDEGELVKVISEKFNMSINTIRDVVLGKTWKVARRQYYGGC